MPGGDRRGPVGEGPMTGRQRGYCAGYDRAGFERPGRGGGYGGRGRSGGSGSRGDGRGYGSRGDGRGYGSRGDGRGYGSRAGDYGTREERVEGFNFGSLLSEIKDGLNSLKARVLKLESREK